MKGAVRWDKDKPTGFITVLKIFLEVLGKCNREIKIHVYSIRQTANVSGEFLRIENKQLKKVQNDSCGQN